MKQVQIRKARQGEFDQIYMMGFDVWADGSQQEYLDECRTSSKYKKGTWYILEEDSQLVSSLILYKFNQNQVGIGSIATPLQLRKQGCASKLLSDVITQIEAETSNTIIFLYSDIAPEFYGKFKFVKLPDSAQRYKTTTCMARGQGVLVHYDKLSIPEYF